MRVGPCGAPPRPPKPPRPSHAAASASAAPGEARKQFSVGQFAVIVFVQLLERGGCCLDFLGGDFAVTVRVERSHDRKHPHESTGTTRRASETAGTTGTSRKTASSAAATGLWSARPFAAAAAFAAFPAAFLRWLRSPRGRSRSESRSVRSRRSPSRRSSRSRSCASALTVIKPGDGRHEFKCESIHSSCWLKN